MVCAKCRLASHCPDYVLIIRRGRLVELQGNYGTRAVTQSHWYWHVYTSGHSRIFLPS